VERPARDEDTPARMRQSRIRPAIALVSLDNTSVSELRYSRIGSGGAIPPVRRGREMALRLNAICKTGSLDPGSGPVHVSMNDYLIHRFRDVPRVAREGLRLRRRWPRTEGALGLWMASFRLGRRQVSVSVWRAPEDLRRFVRSEEHVRIMHEFRDAGSLHTNAWTAERFDPGLIWRQAMDRLMGRVEGVRHH
jgi:hypothetical protein